MPYGVRKLHTSHNLKQYPDSILDLEIDVFDPQVLGPPFPKNLRSLGIHGEFEFEIDEVDLPPSFNKLYGPFDKQELREFNLRAANRYLA